LNTAALANTARREKGATKIRKTKPTTQTPQKVPFQTTNKNKNNTCETCDPTNLEFQQHTTMEGAVATEREREYTYFDT